jgi:hypothetical protein
VSGKECHGILIICVHLYPTLTGPGIRSFMHLRVHEGLRVLNHCPATAALAGPLQRKSNSCESQDRK